MNQRRCTSLLLVVAVLSLGLVSVSSASAEVPGTLKTVPNRAKNSSGTVWTSIHSFICGLVKGSNLEAFTPGGFLIRWTNIGCKEATLENTTVEKVAMVEGTESLQLTGGTVVEPAGCKIPATITTKPLKFKIDHH